MAIAKSITRVTAGKFYVVDRTHDDDGVHIIAGPFDSSEAANEEKRRARMERAMVAVVMAAPRTGAACKVLN